MLNLCWFKHKKIFECFKCFWKVLCFYKNWKISKTVLPNRELACWFWRLVCKWMVQSRGVHRDFRSSARYSLAGRPSSREKHLEIFFTILSLNVLAACPSNLFQLQKLHVLRFEDNFENFFSFSLEFLWLSLSSPFLSQLNLTQTLHVTLLKLHFCIIPSPIFKKNVWVFFVSLDFFMFWE